MKKKGFTLVELLVVIAIIALLMGILMPALNRVRQIAYRMICGTHLKGIGGGMVLYANDYQEAYPIGGPAGSVWSPLGAITAFDERLQTDAFGTQGPSTITASLFMLVKGYDLAPAQFVCKGDSGTKEFKLSDTGTTVTEMTAVWDFGSTATATGPYLIPGQYNSYAYHSPYGISGNITAYPVSVTSNPGSPVCSDRNPYLDRNAWGSTAGSCNGYLNAADGAAGVVAPFWDTASGTGEYKDPDKTGNCAAHQREGQNVLYNDSHVGFEKFPNVGIENDHIWKHWPTTTAPTEPYDRQLGGTTSSSTYSPAGANGATKPQGEQDAYLVSEKNFTP